MMRDVPANRLAILWLAMLLPWVALLAGVHRINHDAAWFFYVARGVMRGGTLYRDFIEPNAPPASLSLVPAVWLGQHLNIGPALAVELGVLAFASVAMGLSIAVLWLLRVPDRCLILASIALLAAFVFLPKSSFAQREHILAMLLTPYVLGCAAVCAGAAVPRGLGAAIGLAAALAVGLKPPFILVPAAVEAVVAARAGIRHVVRTQSVALGVALCAMVGATLVFFPLYASSVVPWATALYSGYDQPDAVRRNIVGALLAGVTIWLAWRAEGAAARGMKDCLAAAVAASLVVYAVQDKGWRYQLFPAWFFVFLLASGTIAASEGWPGGTALSWVRWIPARLLAGGLCVYMVFGQPRAEDMGKFAGVAQAIAAEPGPFLILSTNVSPAFPLALEEDRVWASRTPCLIMLPGLVRAARLGQASKWESTFREWINADLRHYRPALVFVRVKGDQALPPDFDVLAWLLRDPQFASIWTQYRQDGVRDGYRMFRPVH